MGDIRLSLPGTNVDSDPEKHALGILEPASVQTVRIERSRAAADWLKLTAASDDIVEIERSNGIIEMVRADQLADRDGFIALSGDDTSRSTVTLGTHEGGAASRGILDWGVRLIRVLRGVQEPADEIDSTVAERLAEAVGDAVVGRAVAAAADRIDRYMLDPSQPGHLGPGRLRALSDTSASAPTARLLLIHGTFSNTLGSYGGLLAEEPFGLLHRYYRGEGLYGYDHRTLTVSPVDNAIDLLTQLPEGSELDVIGYSRGGLVGELLATYYDDGTQKILDSLKQLPEGSAAPARRLATGLSQIADLKSSKRIRVRRLLRVGSPIQGTWLQDRRLDRHLNVALNVALWAVPGGTTAKVIKNLLVLVLRQRLDAKTLPGLAAMTPTSATLWFLNHHARVREGRAAAIAGDAAVGGGLLNSLKVLAADLVFLNKSNDLVIGTEHMQRSGSEKQLETLVDFGKDVNHFSYFKNSRTREAVVDWIRNVGHPAFRRRELEPAKSSDGPAEETRGAFAVFGTAKVPDVAADRHRPVLLVLPGIMGSHLSKGDNRIWVEIWSMGVGGMGELAFEVRDGELRSRENIRADGLIKPYYQGLIDFMSQHFEVRLVPFDWRQSLEVSAERLANIIESYLNVDRSVQIVAHSMGGLVARGVIANKNDTWRRYRDQGGRLLMLGTPNHGAHRIARVLLGKHDTLQTIETIDVTRNMAELQDIVRNFPGMLQLLPWPAKKDSHPRVEQLWNVDWWMETFRAWRLMKAPDHAVRDLFSAALTKSRATVEMLRDHGVDADRMRYVAGSAPETPCDMRRHPTDHRRVAFRWTEFGDDSVTHESGRLDGVETWYVPASHADLPIHKPSHFGYLELLRDGSTNKLSRQAAPPSERALTRSGLDARGGADFVDEHADDVSDLPPIPPTQGLVESFAFGASRRPLPPDVSRPVIEISIRHDDLVAATNPVLVGHYRDDAITGPEALVDRLNAGYLRLNADAGAYPEDEGQNLLAPADLGAGAIVVGLGTVGALTPGILMRTVATALRRLLVHAWHEGSDPPLGLTPLLIGTNGDRPLSVRQSVRAIVEAVLDANRYGLNQGFPVLEKVEFIEVRQDKATAAARALDTLQGSRNEFEDAFGFGLDIDARLQSGSGGRGFGPVTRGRDEWWRRVTIQAAEGKLEFRIETGLAGTDLRGRDVQDPVVQAFVDALSQGNRRPQADPRNVSRALFELLVPNESKALIDRDESLQLCLDNTAAAMPWEMLQDDSGRRPPVARAGLVRSLETEVRLHRLEARSGRALVVGDPHQTTRWALPGARREARLVADHLQDYGYDVAALGIAEQHRPVPFGEFLVEFLSGDHEIVHIAGHGDVDDEARRSGLLFPPSIESAHEPPQLVTAESLDRSRVPRFVFLNCCHGGAMKTKGAPGVARNRLASSLAVQLMGFGVRALVVAGWAVSDDSAQTFAEFFYATLLSGGTFGEALLRGRQATYDADPYGTTWGAYQAYGDPNFRLATGVGMGATQHYVSGAEAADDVRDIATRSKVADRRQSARLLNDLRQIEEATKTLATTSSFRQALGAAYAELGSWEDAVRSYEQVRDEEKHVRIDTLEQLANVQHRWAFQQVLDGNGVAFSPWVPATGDVGLESPIDKLRSDAIVGLNKLIDLRASSERLSLKGAWFKREALFAVAHHRLQGSAFERGRLIETLLNAFRAYETAGQGSNSPYGLLNKLTFAALLRSVPAATDTLGAYQDSDQLRSEIMEARRLGAVEALRTGSVWDRLASVDADLALYSLLPSATATEDAGTQRRMEAHILAQDYLRIFRRGASHRDVTSVRDTVLFVGEIDAVLNQDAVATQPGGDLASVVRVLDDFLNRTE